MLYYVGLCGTMLYCTVLYYVGPCGDVWSHVGMCGTVWDCVDILFISGT